MTSLNEATELLLADKMLRDCWAIHNALSGLGFEGDDIFVLLGANVAVLLKTQGCEFSVHVGMPVEGAERFGDRWNLVVKGLSGVPESLLSQIWGECPLSHDVGQTVDFIQAIKNKGIKLTSATELVRKPPGQPN